MRNKLLAYATTRLMRASEPVCGRLQTASGGADQKSEALF